MSFLSRVQPSASYILQLKQQADLTAVAAMPRGPERRVAAWKAITDNATASQPAFNAQLDALKGQGLVKEYGSLPLGNSYEVSVPLTKAKEFEAAVQATNAVGLLVKAERGGGDDPGDSKDPKPPTPPTKPDLTPSPTPKPSDEALKGTTKPDTRHPMEDGMGWQVTHSQAQKAWETGADGHGVTVGIIDTGLDWGHPGMSAYRGADGKHDHNWMDFEHHSKAPTDNDAHGTHVAGIVAGTEEGWATGIAPKVKIIAAHGEGTAGIESLQWMLAPTDLRGQNPDPTLGADIVNNSWGFPKEFSHIGKFFETPLKQLEDAGMLMVFAAGNDGPKEDTVLWPGQSAHVLSVGSTTRDDEASNFSSRGKPGATGKDPSDRPDISAPGSAIPSSIPTKGVFGELAMVNLLNIITGGQLGDMSQYGPVPGAKNGNYWTLSGTSMASPFATAVGAMMLSANPALNPQDVKRIMRETSTDLGTPGWDTTFGAGMLNIEGAVKAARAAADTKPEPPKAEPKPEPKTEPKPKTPKGKK